MSARGMRAALSRPVPDSGPLVTGTLINVAAVLAGTLVGRLVGARLPVRLQQRVLAGLGLTTLVIGVDLGLAWRDTSPLYVLGGVLLGGIVGEAWSSRGRPHSTVSEAFFTASLLFCVGPLTVVGSIQDGLTGDYQALATKALLDGFASIALAASLGPGVAFAAVTVLIVQGGISLAAGLFENILAEGSDALAALTSAGGVLIIGISLKLLDVKDVKVGNFLPALVIAPALVGIVSLFH
jgi:uncharacterized membrane protein YqgA involved in biofilm formation